MTAFAKREKGNRARGLARGSYLFRVTEDILVAMEDLGVTKAELAKRLGKSKPRINYSAFEWQLKYDNWYAF